MPSTQTPMPHVASAQGAQRPTQISLTRQMPSTWPQRVLFVCSGNICRSAYAPVIFERLMARDGRTCRVVSAGTLRISGQPAASNMIRAAAEFGDDLTHHISSPLSTVFVQAADLIFVMSPEHAEACLALCPAARNKICYLGTWLNEPRPEIPDPMGKPYEAYQHAAAQLNEALQNWFATAPR